MGKIQNYFSTFDLKDYYTISYLLDADIDQKVVQFPRIAYQSEIMKTYLKAFLNLKR